MTLVDLCKEYLDGKRTAINTIRMVNPDHAIAILTMFCTIFLSIYLKQNQEKKNDVL